MVKAETAVKAVVAAALAVLPTTPALSPTNSASHIQEAHELWAQVAAAALIWACFVLGRYLARGSRSHLRVVTTMARLAAVLSCHTESQELSDREGPVASTLKQSRHSENQWPWNANWLWATSRE
jgi:hypothetical protein